MPASSDPIVVDVVAVDVVPIAVVTVHVEEDVVAVGVPVATVRLPHPSSMLTTKLPSLPCLEIYLNPIFS